MINSLFSSDLNGFEEVSNDKVNSSIGSTSDLIKEVPLNDLVTGDLAFIETRGIETETEKEDEAKEERKSNKIGPVSEKETNTIRETEITKIIEKTSERIEPLIIQTAASLIEPIINSVNREIIQPLVLQSTNFIKESISLKNSEKNLIERLSLNSSSNQTSNNVSSSTERIKTEDEKVKEITESVEKNLESRETERETSSIHQSPIHLEGGNKIFNKSSIINQNNSSYNHTQNSIGDSSNSRYDTTYSSNESFQNSPLHLENNSSNKLTQSETNNRFSAQLERSNLEIAMPKEEKDNRINEMQTAFEGAIKNIKSDSQNSTFFIEKGGSLVSNTNDREKITEKRSDSTTNTTTNNSSQSNLTELSQLISMQTTLLSMIHETLTGSLKVKLNVD